MEVVEDNKGKLLFYVERNKARILVGVEGLSGQDTDYLERWASIGQTYALIEKLRRALNGAERYRERKSKSKPIRVIKRGRWV